ncbi:porin family protein [Chitinophaga sp. GbtcB8]|uniref:porin family protein n=1 Tax=Chitinophaga sp. GbtcB8 TaxID=2824753 RepID=UPI001C2F7004|nr:porin family protein [Chitinophaga sp. GbtcB8]
MKKFILSMLLAASAVVTVQAQKIHIGAKGGLNIANLTEIDNSKARVSGHVGGFVNIRFHQWALQPELYFSGQGAKYEVGLTNADRTLALNYINMPVMFQYYIIPQFYLEAGPQLSLLVSAHDKGGNLSVDTKDLYNSADISAGIGLGVKLPFHFGVYGRYNFGITDIYDSAIDSRNSVGQIGVSYTFF